MMHLGNGDMENGNSTVNVTSLVSM